MTDALHVPRTPTTSQATYRPPTEGRDHLRSTEVQVPAHRGWREPRPSAALMWILGIVNGWFLLRGLPGLRHIPVIRDLPFVRGYFRVRRLNLSAADRATLHSAVNADTVAFLAPNHPEFGADWIIDKEISTLVCPRMVSWASKEIVGGAPRFWAANNLVANHGGDDAKEYSVRSAIDGHGVLLHPEGSVRWTNDHVHALFPGVAQMAVRAAARTDKPVFIVPLVWKFQFVGNVSRALDREIRTIATALGLPRSQGPTVAHRFKALQLDILGRQMGRFGYAEPVAIAGCDFFDRQRAFRQWIVEGLERRHPILPAETVERRIARVARAITARRSAIRGDHSRRAAAEREALDRDHALAQEAARLGEFTREIYGTPMLTQEQLSESVKRTRSRLLKRGWADTVANMLPKPLGPRIVHVGVPTPIQVTASQTADYEASLVELTRVRMQEELDRINRKIEGEVRRYSVANPF